MLTIIFTATQFTTYRIVKHNGIEVSRDVTHNVMNLLDGGYFKSFIAFGYSSEEMSIRIDRSVDAYDKEYIERAWAMFQEV